MHAADEPSHVLPSKQHAAWLQVRAAHLRNDHPMLEHDADFSGRRERDDRYNYAAHAAVRFRRCCQVQPYRRFADSAEKRTRWHVCVRLPIPAGGNQECARHERRQSGVHAGAAVPGLIAVPAVPLWRSQPRRQEYSHPHHVRKRPGATLWLPPRLVAADSDLAASQGASA